MSFLHDVLKIVFGPPAKRRPLPSRPLPSVPVTDNGTGPSETRRPSQPRQPKPRPQPEGLTVRQLQDALGLASKLVVARSSLPILSYCLLKNGKLTTTDLDNYLTFDLPGLDIAPVCLPVALLQKALRFVKDPIRLVKQGGNVILNDTFTLPGMDPQEFPASPARAVQQQIGEAFPVPERWVDVLPAMSVDETRINLSGVCIDLAAGYCVSSDGHRLHALKIPTGAVAAQGIVALPAAKLIVRLLARGEVIGRLYTQRPTLSKEQEELLATEISDVTSETVRQKREILKKDLERPTYACFRVSGIELWTRLVEGEFPDYQQVLQRPAKLSHVTMPKAPLLAAVKACLTCAPKDRLGVSLTRLPAGIRVRLEATDNGSVERVIECRGWQPGRYVGVNARYLLEALACVRRDEVTLAMKDEASPVHIADEDLSVVISPLRVSEPAECQKDKKEGGVPEQSGETAKTSQAE
jgi:DNA polymerase III sliding clamp (beta) subunit (PCNA family)